MFCYLIEQFDELLNFMRIVTAFLIRSNILIWSPWQRELSYLKCPLTSCANIADDAQFMTFWDTKQPTKDELTKID